ncbi:hypothetical protein CYG48_18430 (plasmid) [Neorhizobium sp. SOG26]|nr:hypothetical protein CYG48_18430 [Neorhizobium sp. SOG26]
MQKKGSRRGRRAFLKRSILKGRWDRFGRFVCPALYECAKDPQHQIGQQIKESHPEVCVKKGAALLWVPQLAVRQALDKWRTLCDQG